MSEATVETPKTKRQVNRKSICDLDVLAQATRIKGLVEKCGDKDRQMKVLELVNSALS